MTDTLFELPALPTETPGLSIGARRTARQQRLIASGINPATHQPVIAGGFTCGDCVQCVQVGHNSRSYYKCDASQLGRSRSASSDIRLSWPACTLYSRPGDS